MCLRWCIEPGVALARSTGQRGPKRLLSIDSEQRKAARIEIAKATELEEPTIES